VDDACGVGGAVRPDTPELYFCRDLQGYAWCVRKDGYLNVGIGRLDARSLPSHMSAFARMLADSGRTASGPPRLKGHAYLLYPDSPRPLGADGVLLVGDAAGLAYEASGEGIRPAIESGILLVREESRAELICI
jgi:flavin-dependent dehydrogenase